MGERKTLFLVQPGHFFLEAYLFCKSLVASQAEAVMDTQTAYFKRSLVTNLIHDGSPFVDNLLYSLSCKALAAGTDVAITAYVNSDDRLLHVLRCFADCEASHTEAGRVINISQGDLAELVGMHRVSINRTLKRLEGQGILKTGRKRIVLLE
jgi:CRP-like cAMP-binding protein